MRLDDDGRRQDGEAEIAEQLVEAVDQPEHRLGDEIEPAPVDQKVELADAQVLFIGVDLRDFLGAGEHQRLHGLRLPRRDGEGIRQEVGLEAGPAVLEIGEAGLERLLDLRHQRDGPVFVGDAQPAIRRFRRLHLLVLFDRRICELGEAFFAGHADQAFMQHVDAGGRRLVEARDAAVVGKRDRPCAGVLDRVGNLEHVVAVDRDRAREGEPGRIDVAERHRRRRRQRLIAFGFPDGVGTRHRPGRRVADETELGILPVWQRRRVEQLDLRRILVDGQPVMLQLDVVDAAAGQVDRARDAGGVDLDALCRGDRRLACRSCGAFTAGNIGRHRAARRGGDCLAWFRGGDCVARIRGRILLLFFDPRCFDLGSLALGFDARVHVEHLPKRQDQHGRGDGDEQISVIFHACFRGSGERVRLSIGRKGRRGLPPARRSHNHCPLPCHLQRGRASPP